jgi:hypothetical protein
MRVDMQPLSLRSFSAALSLLLLASLSGCTLFGPPKPKPYVDQTPPPYAGLRDKTVAIVVYAPQATVDEYPGVREEISSFLTREFRANMPTTQLVDPRQVIAWQSSTLNWIGLSEAEIARHFAVDRVLFVEVLDYSTKRPLGYSTLQGHVRAFCRITESDQAGGSAETTTAPAEGHAAWSGVVDVHWPARALDPVQTSESAIRLRTLELFAGRTVRSFYDGVAVP